MCLFIRAFDAFFNFHLIFYMMIRLALNTILGFTWLTPVDASDGDKVDQNAQGFGMP